jgi:hydrogenase maturation protease
MTAPLLVFGWGNPSRGDDALGPLFVEMLQGLVGGGLAGRVDFLDDYQLQIEHALDLVGRSAVLFVDASLVCASPFEVTTLRPSRDASFSSHALSPQSVMQVYRDLYRQDPAPCTLLAIRAARFGLGECPDPGSLSNLTQALAWGRRWLAHAREPSHVPDVATRDLA